MTRDDIIRMAIDAHLLNYVDNETPRRYFICADADVEEVERFAALVAAAEREACAKVCERLPETFKIVADEFGYKAETPTAENYAAAIRTRSDE